MIGGVLERLVSGSDIRVRSHLCTRVRYPRSKCRICEDVCPCNAVRIHKGAVSLLEGCSGCEACIPACPSGVFTQTSERERERLNQLKRAVQEDAVARFSCDGQENPDAKADVTFPCLGGVPAAYLVAPLAWGGEKVQIKRGECSSCPLGCAASQFDQTLRQARQLLSCFGIAAERLEEVDRFDGGDLSGACLGRREFFRLFRTRTVERTLGLISEPGGNLKEIRWARRENPLRAFLLELLPGLGDIGDGILSSTDFPVADLEVSDACVGCNVCETLCPTSAVRRELRDDQEVRLMFTLSRCVGCKICGQACLAEAISFSETVGLKELIQGEEKELIRVPPKSCQICGEPFHGLRGESCARCFGSLRSRGC